MEPIKLVQTCGGCPESYDVYIANELIGDLYLRHGYFQATYRGRTVFTGNPIGDGIFEWDERELWLNNACRAILAAHNINGEKLYEIVKLEEEAESE